MEVLSAVGKPSRPRSQRPRHSIVRQQSRGIHGHYKIAAPRNHRAHWKCVIHPARERPPRHVHIHRHLVVQFDVFPGCLRRVRVIVDFVEDDDGVAAGSDSENGEESGDQFHREVWDAAWRPLKESLDSHAVREGSRSGEARISDGIEFMSGKKAGKSAGNFENFERFMM